MPTNRYLLQQLNVNNIIFNVIIGNHGLIYTIVIVRFVSKTEIKRIINHSELLRVIVLLSWF